MIRKVKEYFLLIIALIFASPALQARPAKKAAVVFGKFKLKRL